MHVYVYVHVYIHARVFVHASFAELLSEMDMRAPYVFLSVHVCRRASGSWPVRRWIGVGRNATGVAAMRFQRVVHREREERLCVRACMRAGHGTRCNDDSGGDFNDDGGGGTRIEDEGGRKKDRLG